MKVPVRHATPHEKVWKQMESMYEPAVSQTESTQSIPHWLAIATKKPEPLADAARYGLVGEYLKLVEPVSEADPAAILTQFLCAFGNVIGRSAHFKVEDDLHFLKLFVAIVGRSAKARKGVSWNRVKKAFRATDEDWVDKRILSGLSSGEGLISAVRDPGTKQKRDGSLEDPGVCDKRLLVYEPELASVFRVMIREGNTLTSLIRQAWDHGSLQTLTKQPMTATNPHISIVAQITQEDLKRYLTETDAANGFGNRFLWIYSERSKRLPFPLPIDRFKLSAFLQKLAKAVKKGKNVGEITFDEHAQDRWREIYEALAVEQDGLYGALTARAEPQVLRMAGIYALLALSPVVRIQHLEAAYAVWLYANATVAYLFGNLLGDSIADRILAKLEAMPEGLTRSGIHDLFSHQPTADRLNQSLASLIKRNLIYYTTEATGGRPTERWFIR